MRTALNPLLWLTAVVTPICLLFGAIVGLDTSTGWLLIALASLPVFASLIAYLGFALTNPDRLQSEEFLLRQQEILILSKGGDVKRPETLELEWNPQLKENGPEGEQKE